MRGREGQAEGEAQARRRPVRLTLPTRFGPARFPGLVLIDTREQSPWSFDAMTADERDGGGPLIVSTVRATLASGDYSLDGYADRVAVERKSLADLYGTLGGGRERFERELRRLNEMDYAAVVIEADWSTIINHPPRRSRLTPKSVFRSVVAWQQRWPYVHWWAMPGRDYAEQAAFRILERFWRNRE